MNAICFSTQEPEAHVHILGLTEILVVASDADCGLSLAEMLAEHNFLPVLCSRLREARSLLRRGAIQLVFCEDDLADGTFRDLLNEIERLGSGVPLVAFSPLAECMAHSETAQSGAFDRVSTPFQSREIERVLHRALLRQPSALPKGISESTRHLVAMGRHVVFVSPDSLIFPRE